MASSKGKANLRDVGAGKPPANPSAITALTDNSGGTAADTIAVIGGTYTQSEVQNAVASLAAKINELRTILEDHGIAT